MRLSEHLEPVDHLLSTTPSVRRKLDLDRPVDDAVLLECLRLAVEAPTPGNGQTWRWLVVRDQERKNAVGALFRQAGQAYLEGLRGSASPQQLASGQALIDVIERVPVLIIPCLLGRPPEGNAAQSVFYGGIFPAVWSLQLALRARGLGSTLTSYHLQHEAEAADALGIPDDVTQVGLLPVAYTTADDFRTPPRHPADELTYQDRWGELLARTGR